MRRCSSSPHHISSHAAAYFMSIRGKQPTVDNVNQRLHLQCFNMLFITADTAINLHGVDRKIKEILGKINIGLIFNNIQPTPIFLVINTK